ncbi:MAG: hypothetical protein WCG27_11920, partial [Pseudomonadota bacterium]
MKKVNKIIIIFFLSIAAILIVSWRIIEGNKFARILSLKINERLIQQTGLTFAFDKMKIKIFPLATIFEGVRIAESGGVNKTPIRRLNFQGVGVYFDVLDFFSNRLV